MKQLLLIFITVKVLVAKGQAPACRFAAGQGCLYRCNCAGTCHPQTGCVGNCTRGWDGPTCQRRNVALAQPTSQRSSFLSYVSNYAVDGKLGHNLENTPCTHSQYLTYQGWWSVNLNRTYSIYRFQIYNRVGQCEEGWRTYKPCGFTLSVGTNNQSYSTCYTDTTTRDYGPGDIINATCNDTNPRTGNTVRIGLPTSRPLILCEVLLFGCVPGRWGTDCDQDCGHCWNNTACDKNTGHCLHTSPRCQAGYEGNNCTTPCDSGKWGDKCATPVERTVSVTPVTLRLVSAREDVIRVTQGNTVTQTVGLDHGEIPVSARAVRIAWSSRVTLRPVPVREDVNRGTPGNFVRLVNNSHREFSVTNVDYTGVIVGCVIGIILTAVLITAVVLCVRRRQSGGSEGAEVSAENTDVTQGMSHAEPPSFTQGPGTDPVTYYNMAAEEEHPYETVPEKEYDKILFSRLDTETNYASLT